MEKRLKIVYLEFNESLFNRDMEVWFACGSNPISKPKKESGKYNTPKFGYLVGSYYNPDDKTNPYLIIQEIPFSSLKVVLMKECKLQYE